MCMGFSVCTCLSSLSLSYLWKCEHISLKNIFYKKYNPVKAEKICHLYWRSVSLGRHLKVGTRNWMPFHKTWVVHNRSGLPLTAISLAMRHLTDYLRREEGWPKRSPQVSFTQAKTIIKGKQKKTLTASHLKQSRLTLQARKRRKVTRDWEQSLQTQDITCSLSAFESSQSTSAAQP